MSKTRPEFIKPFHKKRYSKTYTGRYMPKWWNDHWNRNFMLKKFKTHMEINLSKIGWLRK